MKFQGGTLFLGHCFKHISP